MSTGAGGRATVGLVGELVVLLLPEMVGLLVTPAAVVACLVLLASTSPLRNVVTFAGAFLGCYAVITAVVLTVGRAAGAADSSSATARGGVSVAVGTLFLLGAVLTWRRAERAAPGPPAWVQRMQEPTPRLLLTLGAVLSLLNPNLAILGSGLTMVLASEVGPGGEVLGAVLLLASSALDFVVPTAVFLVAGDSGRRALRRLSGWLVAHDRSIGIGVLLGFGLLFVVRGLTQLA